MQGFREDVKIFDMDRNFIAEARMVKKEDAVTVIVFDVSTEDDLKTKFQEDVILCLAHNVEGLCYFRAKARKFYDSEVWRSVSVTFSFIEKLETIQRRRDIKIKVDHMEISLVLPWRDNKEIKAELLDISAGGMLFAYKEEMLMPQEQVIYHFEGCKMPFDVTAKILRVQDFEKEGRCYACIFEDLRMDQEASIRQFVFQMQKKDRLREKEREAFLQEMMEREAELREE